ncbi:MAG: class I SAM-dependent methyltransferase, partial [Candidatus Omnitrophica bacterium]|nr:class I SAM-dependent methyltransferase [Candidatus Omnitrophota bacterium]
MEADLENKCLNWIDYWNQDSFWKDSPLWQINARLFSKSASRVMEFKKSDSVLDIGCGPGYVEAMLAPSVKSIYALDVAKQFVDICSLRCRKHLNVRVGHLRKDDYANLEEYAGPFSIVLCVSVVQYYQDMGELEKLISSVRKIVSPGARMLIADLPLERKIWGFFWDALCSYFLSLREGYAGVLLRTAFARWLEATDYKAFQDQTKQLYFTTEKLKLLINRLGLKAKVIRGDFSV